jgi:inorganic pyrophosphatase
MRDERIDVLVETPGGSRQRYEYDPEREALRLDRRLPSAAVYPADYGFVADALGPDGEALDAMVLVHEPTFPGCWVLARPIGVVWLAHEDGRDAKILAVPEDDPDWADVGDIDDVEGQLREEITRFFAVYCTLGPGRARRLDGEDGRHAAVAVIADARRRAWEVEARRASDDDDVWLDESAAGPGDLVI